MGSTSGNTWGQADQLLKEVVMLSRIRIFGVVAMAILFVCSASGQAAKVDLTGTWTFTIMSDAGVGTPTVTFKQDGEKLTGHY